MRNNIFKSKALRCLCAASLALAYSGVGTVGTAFAAGGSGDGIAVQAASTVACENGWELSYSSDEAKACITGVATTGNGKLTIPSEINGLPVKMIGAGAFKGNAQLKSVVIPDSVEVMKTEAFLEAGLESVEIGSSVQAIPYRCFKSCRSLTDVTFKGSSMMYLGQEAFMYCSSLTEITLPFLTSYPKVRSDADSLDYAGVELFGQTCAIGMSCFAQCSSLVTITYGGMVGHSTPKYFLDISCFNGCSKLAQFIWKCKKDTVSSGTSGNRQFTIEDYYYSLDFYNSEDDASKMENRVASVAYEQYKSGEEHPVVKLLDLVNGKNDYADYKLPSCTDSIPQCPEGKVWGIADNAVTGSYSTISNSYQVIAVDKGNLDYGWISSDAIFDFFDKVEYRFGTNGYGTNTYPIFYLESDGTIPEVDTLGIYAADGSKLTGSQYVFKFEKAVMYQNPANFNWSASDWVEVDSIDPDSVNRANGAPNWYRIWAENTENGTATAPVTVNVQKFASNVVSYTNGETPIEVLGAMTSESANLLEKEPEYNVIVPCSDWRYQLIGAGLAGASGGLLLFDDGANTSSDAYRGHRLSGADSVQIVGSTSVVPQSVDTKDNRYLSDWLINSCKTSKTRYKNDSTIQELSDQVYSTMTRGVWESTWGDTAIVCSSASAVDTLAIARIAYAKKAPVFFTGSDGMLTSKDLAYLKSGDFSSIVIAGDASYVSDKCVSAIQSATAVTPERVLDQGDNACQASINFAQQLVDQGASFDTVCIADGTNSANITQAAETAAISNGVVVACSSLRDLKDAEAFVNSLVEKRASSVKNVYLVGTFASLDPQVEKRFTSIWATPTDMAHATTDTVEAGGVIYKLGSSNTAQVVGVLGTAPSSVSVDSFTLDGTTYKVTSVAANAFGSRIEKITLGANVSSINSAAFASAKNVKSIEIKNPNITSVASSLFANHAKLTSVSYAGKVTSVGSSAFKNCTALTSVRLGSGVSSIGSYAFSGCKALSSVNLGSSVSAVGSYAFYGCTALKSAALGSNVKAIGAAAFSGCKALASVGTGTKVVTVGVSAFYGCAALKSVSFGANVTTVGKSAFQGCKSLGSITLGTKLKSIGAAAFNGCAKLKKITIKSTKLTSSKVGSKAFSGVYKKATVKVPKKKLKSYKTLLKKKGMPSKASFKKC